MLNKLQSKQTGKGTKMTGNNYKIKIVTENGRRIFTFRHLWLYNYNTCPHRNWLTMINDFIKGGHYQSPQESPDRFRSII